MQTERIKKIFFWTLVISCMGVIFYFSSRTATDSTEESNAVINFISKIFHNELTSFVVRKCAHFSEYILLAVLFNLALYFQLNKKCSFLSIVFSSLYAMTDEFHQLFVSGRSCELRDWAIDTLGAIVGSLIFFIIFKILEKIRNKRKNIIDTELN